jgi:hypothetical protein
MFYVQTNTANQTAYLSLKEGELILAATYTHYLVKLVHVNTGQEFFFIPTVLSENDRVTHLQFQTNVNDPENGGVLLVDPGRYNYYIYAQNSATNLDPLLSLGLIEEGFMEANWGATYYQTPNFTTPSDYIYNGQ